MNVLLIDGRACDTQVQSALKVARRMSQKPPQEHPASAVKHAKSSLYKLDRLIGAHGRAHVLPSGSDAFQLHEAYEG